MNEIESFLIAGIAIMQLINSIRVDYLVSRIELLENRS